MKFTLATAIAIAAISTSAFAAPVDLSTWSVEQGPGSQPPGNWSLAGDNNSVTQSVNSQVSVFYDGAASSHGKALSGTIRVNTTSDDDFIGFVLGMDAGEIDGTAASVDYWLIDWKQLDQSDPGGFAADGLALSHVTGSTTDEFDFWSHQGVVNEVQRGANLGSTGWSDLTTYNFDLIFTSTLIQVKVDGVTELNYTSAQHGSLFLDGGFGFFNYSQGNVTYAGIEEDPAPVIPLPAGLPMLGGALVLLGFMRRRA